MPSSGPRSGKHGGVSYNTGGANTLLSAIRNWMFNLTSTPEDYVHSGTRGGHDVVGGVYDGSGTFDQYGAIPSLFPGDLFNFIGFTAPDTGVYGTSGNAITTPAILDSLSVNWDWSPGGKLSMSSNFSTNGCPDLDNAFTYIEAADFCPTRMCDLSIWYQKVCDADGPGSGSGSGSGGGGALTQVANLLSAALNFTADNQVVVNSSTLCCTERRPGNLNWNLTLVDQDTYVQFEQDDVYLFQLYVTGTLYWELAWGQFIGVDNINVNRETGEIISKTNNFTMKGLLCCPPASSPTVGYVKSPGLITEWPIAAP